MSVITVILLLTGYCGYFIATRASYLSKSHKLCSRSGLCVDFAKLNYLHLGGIILMGLPLIFLNKQAAIFLTGPLSVDGQKWLVLLALTRLTAYVGRRTAVNASPKLSETNSLKKANLLLIYLPVRILFLVSYEFFFRGVLLAVSIYYLDITWAVLLNIALYTLLHFFSGKNELIFCPLFGAVLCMLTIWFHSVLPAVILHVTLSISHEGYILRTINQQLKPYRL